MSRISLSSKIIACFLGILLLSILTSGIALLSMNRIQGHTENLMKLRTISTQMEIDVAVGFRNAREYILATKSTNELTDYDDAFKFLKHAEAGGHKLTKMLSESDYRFMQSQAEQSVQLIEQYGSRLQQFKQLFGNLFAMSDSAVFNLNTLQKSLEQSANSANYSMVIEISQKIAIIQVSIANAINARDPSILDATDVVLQDAITQLNGIKTISIRSRSKLFMDIDACIAQLSKDIADIKEILTVLQTHASEQTAIRMQLSKDISAVSWSIDDAVTRTAVIFDNTLATTSKVVTFFMVLMIVMGLVSMVFIKLLVEREMKNFVEMLDNSVR